MDRTEFAHQIFLSQDERSAENDFVSLLISKIILEAKDIDEFVCDMYYWIEQMEEAISEAEYIESINVDTDFTN